MSKEWINKKVVSYRAKNENTVDINAVQQQIKLTFDTITTLLGGNN